MRCCQMVMGPAGTGKVSGVKLSPWRSDHRGANCALVGSGCSHLRLAAVDVLQKHARILRRLGSHDVRREPGSCCGLL